MEGAANSTYNSTENKCENATTGWLPSPDVVNKAGYISCFPIPKETGLMSEAVAVMETGFAIAGSLITIIIATIFFWIIKKNRCLLFCITLRSLPTVVIKIALITNYAILKTVVLCETLYAMEQFLTSWVWCWCFVESRHLFALAMPNAVYVEVPCRKLYVTVAALLPTSIWLLFSYEFAGSCWEDPTFAMLAWIVKAPRLVCLFLSLVYHGKSMKRTLEIPLAPGERRSIFLATRRSTVSFSSLCITASVLLIGVLQYVTGDNIGRLFAAFEGAMIVLAYTTRFQLIPTLDWINGWCNSTFGFTFLRRRRREVVRMRRTSIFSASSPGPAKTYQAPMLIRSQSLDRKPIYVMPPPMPRSEST